MNYLLFRAPSYGDDREKPEYDAYLVFPDDVKNTFKHFEQKIDFKFKDSNCVNVGLSFDEISSMKEDDWKYFQTACRILARSKKSRNHITNIDTTRI